jgi:hypothetical protein
MHGPRKRWLVLAVVVVAFALIILSSRNSPRLDKAVTISFVGYTNPPNNTHRFALFSASNQGPYSIVWRGRWAEVEGSPEHQAETLNPFLPGYTIERILKGGHSVTMAIGEPLDPMQVGRWRFAMGFSRYSFQERCLDLSSGHKFLTKLAWRLGVDGQRILSPSNQVTVSTTWLTK